jgi:hypothetical protein
MVADSSARRGARSGMSTSYLVAGQRPYGRTLGCPTRMLRVLVLIRCGLRRGDNKGKAGGSTDQPASHMLLLLLKPDPNGASRAMVASRS